MESSKEEPLFSIGTTTTTPPTTATTTTTTTTTTSIDNATMALRQAASFAGDAALRNAFRLRSRSRDIIIMLFTIADADPAYTDAAAAVALAAATAAYDVAGIETSYGTRTMLETVADDARSYAEAASAAARIYRQKSFASLTSILPCIFISIQLMFTSVVRLVVWLVPWLVVVFVSGRPGPFDVLDCFSHNLGFTLGLVVDAAVASSHAAQSAVEAAVARNKPLLSTSSSSSSSSQSAAAGLQLKEPHDLLDDLERLYHSARLASASAALATAAADAVRARHPIAALRAARAAAAATSASGHATATRLALLTEITEKRYNTNEAGRHAGENLRECLTMLEAFRSEAEQFAVMSNSKIQQPAVSISVNYILYLFTEDIKKGKLTASKRTTDSGADDLDKASSVTFGASPPPQRANEDTFDESNNV